MIVSDGALGSIVIWADGRDVGPLGSGVDIFAQRMRSDGTPLWAVNGLPVKSYPGDQIVPAVVADGQGGAVVAWQDSSNGNWDIYAQRVNPLGVVSWGYMNGLAVCSAPGDQAEPALALDDSGGVFITWQDGRAGEPDIYAQRVTLSGGRDWPEHGIAVSVAADDPIWPVVATDALGALIVWSDRRNGDRHIFAQRLSRTATCCHGLLAELTSRQAWIVLTITLRFVTVAAGQSSLRGTGYPTTTAGAYVQGIDASGNTAGNLTTLWSSGGVPDDLAATSDGQGGAIIAWRDSRHGNGALDLFVQNVDGDGQARWIYGGEEVCAAVSEQKLPCLVADGIGGAIIAWQDYRNGNWDIYAQVISHEGQVGAYWAPPIVPNGLQASMLNSRSITLSWTPTDNIQEYRLYRGPSEAQLSLIATVPSGTTQYVDEEGLAAGTLYYYKVQSANPRGESTLSDAISARTNQPPSGEVVSAAGAIGSNCTLSFNASDPDQPGASRSSRRTTAGAARRHLSGPRQLWWREPGRAPSRVPR
ncbi:MAG: fibronectin type III domain-containing protein [bacterium]|nr:fibronectin type III domain-containing protein [bacterium]